MPTKYRKLTPRDILRWDDEYKSEVPPNRWLKVYGPAVGSRHTVGMHPREGFEYRRPLNPGDPHA